MPRPKNINVTKFRKSLQEKTRKKEDEAAKRIKYYNEVRETLNDDLSTSRRFGRVGKNNEDDDDNDDDTDELTRGAVVIPSVSQRNNYRRPFMPEERQILLALQNFYADSAAVITPVIQRGIDMLQQQLAKIAALLEQIHTPRSTESLRKILDSCAKIRAPQSGMGQPALDAVERVIYSCNQVIIYRETVDAPIASLAEIQLAWDQDRRAGETGLDALHAVRLFFESVLEKLTQAQARMQHFSQIIENLAENVPRKFRIAISD